MGYHVFVAVRCMMMKMVHETRAVYCAWQTFFRHLDGVSRYELTSASSSERRHRRSRKYRLARDSTESTVDFLRGRVACEDNRNLIGKGNNVSRLVGVQERFFRWNLVSSAVLKAQGSIVTCT